MRVEISDAAAGFVRAHGGRLWVWAAYPRLRCCGMQAWMRASMQKPADLAGFTQLHAAGVDVRFRSLGGRAPEVLEIGLHGRHRPQVEAYWDGCCYAL